jgi:CheY-like chemotaxis protein
MDTYLEQIDVKDVITEILLTTNHMVVKNNNTVTLHCDDSPSIINTDATKFRQVMYNVVSNANKFTKNGKIDIHVTFNTQLSKAKTKESWLKVDIVDTGIGMKPEQLSNIFKAFSQADNTTTRKFGGTGLGLAICKGLCSLMGGIISVDSNEGKGSSFTIRLPVSSPLQSYASLDKVLEIGPKVDPALVRLGAKRDGGHQKRSKVSTILSIDDDAEVRDLMERFMTRRGFYTHTAASVDEGLALAKKINPDIIITDIMMPEKDGIYLLKAVKASPELRHIPVVVLTIAGEREICMSLGAAAYLNKPVDWDVLFDMVCDAMRRAFAAKNNLSA